MLEGPVLSYSSLFCGRLVGTSLIQSTMANFLHVWSNVHDSLQLQIGNHFTLQNLIQQTHSNLAGGRSD